MKSCLHSKQPHRVASSEPRRCRAGPSTAFATLLFLLIGVPATRRTGKHDQTTTATIPVPITVAISMVTLSDAALFLVAHQTVSEFTAALAKDIEDSGASGKVKH